MAGPRVQLESLPLYPNEFPPLAIGVVTTGAPGTQVSANVLTRNGEQQLDLTIPQGAPGDTSAAEAIATAAETAAGQAVTTAGAAQTTANKAAAVAPSLSPLLFGAKFDGVTDDTASFVAAANAAAALGIGITMPMGTTVLSPIAFPAIPFFIGQGKSATKIIASRAVTYGAGSNVLSFANPIDTSGYAVDVDDAKFALATAINCQGITGAASVHGVKVTGRPYFGIQVNTVSGKVEVSGNEVAFTDPSSTIGIIVAHVADGEERWLGESEQVG